MGERTTNKRDKAERTRKSDGGPSSAGETCIKANVSCEWNVVPGFIVHINRDGSLCLQNLKEYGKGWDRPVSAECEKGAGPPPDWGDEEVGDEQTHAVAVLINQSNEQAPRTSELWRAAAEFPDLLLTALAEPQKAMRRPGLFFLCAVAITILIIL